MRLDLRAINALGLGFVVCLLSLPVAAAPNVGKISGVVVDPAGTPQMGATVLVSSEQLLAGSPVQLLTNDHGRFSTTALPAGLYSIRVTLAGFLPAMEQHIDVDNQHATLLQIVLGSMFSSFEKLRRQPDQPVATDDWTWVLRTSAATRTVLRWQDSEGALDAALTRGDVAPAQSYRGRIEMTSGAEHPGSISSLPDSPGTAFVYDVGLGGKSQLVMAGQLSVENGSASGSFAGEWLPTGEAAAGPVTTILVRQSRLGVHGPQFRGLRMSHDDQFLLGDRVSVRYGADYLMAGFGGTTSALRPRGEVAVQVAPGWQLSTTVATGAWQDATAGEDALQSTLNTLDAFPTLLLRRGRPLLANDLHEELAVDHALNSRAHLIASVFHDTSSHTAVMGRGGSGNHDLLQDYFSEVFAYDGGASSSTGARVAYREKFSPTLSTTVVYAYGGALAPDGDASPRGLRSQLETRYRQSLAAGVTAKIPRLGTKFTTSYKWLNGATVSQQDSYGESLYHIDPYLSVGIRQPLPGHMEVQADMGNLLAQGYVPIMTGEGSALVLIPSYRYFRGGLSLQF